jgi:hypothetical protein
MSNIPANEPPSAQRREVKNALAFLDHIGEVTGRKLRPTSIYSLTAMQLLGLVKMGEDGKITHNTAMLKRDISDTYLFIHAAPERAVSKAVRSYERAATAGDADAWENFIGDHVAPFLMSLTPDLVTELEEELSKADEITAAQVHASPPKRTGKEETPDPNS